MLLFPRCKTKQCSFLYSYCPAHAKWLAKLLSFMLTLKKRGLQMQFLWDQGFPPIQIRNTAYNRTIGVRLKAARVTNLQNYNLWQQLVSMGRLSRIRSIFLLRLNNQEQNHWFSSPWRYEEGTNRQTCAGNEFVMLKKVRAFQTNSNSSSRLWVWTAANIAGKTPGERLPLTLQRL